LRYDRRARIEKLRSYEEINTKIKKGDAVVMSAMNFPDIQKITESA